MRIDQELFRKLEQVVGKENISFDPAVLESYAWRSGCAAGGYEFAPHFLAVVLPGNTQEVAEVVRLCNQYDTLYRATSTGWGPMNDPASDNVIRLDLRRMNRIIEINEEDMYVVVEPYVTGAQLQAELMKRGLLCNLNGAGAQCSAFPLAAHENLGHLGQTCSGGERNQLAAEWVTPQGEIVRLGSVEHNGEWFCGDGPGPSLRALLRGPITPCGGFGVYTKAAMKLYHWAGPAQVKVKGVSPNYALEEMPERFAVRFLSFRDIATREEALKRLSEEELSLVFMGFSNGMMSANIAKDNEEDLRLLAELEADSIGPTFVTIIMGNSENDFAFKLRTLTQIVEDLDGHSWKRLEDDPDLASGLLWRCIRITASIRETMRATGAFCGIVSGTDNTPLMENYIIAALPDKRRAIEAGVLCDNGCDPFICSFEHGHYGHGELLMTYNPTIPGIAEGFGEVIGKSLERCVNMRYGVPHQCSGDGPVDMFSPETFNFGKWMREIKEKFDPLDVSEGTSYVSFRKRS